MPLSGGTELYSEVYFSLETKPTENNISESIM
jgi:hypothetical protein